MWHCPGNQRPGSSSQAGGWRSSIPAHRKYFKGSVSWDFLPLYFSQIQAPVKQAEVSSNLVSIFSEIFDHNVWNFFDHPLFIMHNAEFLINLNFPAEYKKIGNTSARLSGAQLGLNHEKIEVEILVTDSLLTRSEFLGTGSWHDVSQIYIKYSESRIFCYSYLEKHLIQNVWFRIC